MTRFAIPFKEDDEFYDQGREWIDKRFELFEKYTLPSVQAQTCKDFDWALVVNMEFPHWTDADWMRLVSYGYKVWCLNTVWDRECVGAEFDYGLCIKSRSDEDWYITSRLDSDDVLLPNYIEGIQSKFTEEKQWIGFDNGLVYDVDTDTTYSRTYKNSPFVSLVEHRDTVKGVYQLPHTAATKEFNYVSVDTDEPGWMQVIHGSNVKNTAERVLPKCRRIT
jgi:hypothetical protein